MLNELKRITSSQKMRILMLFAVLAIVATVVVLAIDGAYGDPEDEYYHNYIVYVSDDYYHDGYHYDDYIPHYAYIGDEHARAFAAYMDEMAGEAGDAPVFLYEDDDDYDS